MHRKDSIGNPGIARPSNVKNYKDITTISRNRNINAIILSTIIIVAVFIGVVTKLVAVSTAEDPDEGIRSFRYFTVLSNMLMAFCVTLCIPFEIDGLRNQNYHLPRWAIETLYIGACCVSVTFSVALCIISPIDGFEATMLQKANFFLHTICPISSIILVILINDDHNIPFKHSLIVLAPILAYAFTYWLEVFAIGENNGGWRDIYYTNAFVPYWIPMICFPLVGIGLANLIRILHNKRHEQHRQATREYILYSDEYSCDCISDAVTKLAEKHRKRDHGGGIVVPRRLITLLKERYQSSLPLEELYNIYIYAYLNSR